MINDTESITILSQLSALGIGPESSEQASAVYLIVQFIRSSSENNIFDEDTATDVMHSLVFSDFAKKTQIDVSSIPSPSFLASFNELCHKLQVSSFEYYDLIYPYLVHDQHSFINIIGRNPLHITIMLHIFTSVASQYDESSIPREFENEDFSNWEQAISICFPQSSNKKSDVMDLWYTCFFTETSKSHFEKRKAITSFFEVCKINKLNPQDYLCDYLKIYREAPQFKRAKAHLAAALADPYFETYSPNLITALVGMRSEFPSYVIHYLYYVNSEGKNLDDYALEASLVLNEFNAIRPSTSSSLIVYPSPRFIKHFCTNNSLNGQTTILLENDLLCDLYGAEFPSYHFVSSDDIADMHSAFDCVLVFNHRISTTAIALPYHAIQENAPILALVPQTHFTNKDIIQALYTNHFHINRIVAIPTQLTATKPGKKALVYAQKASEGTPPPSIQLFFAQPCYANCIYIPKNALSFQHEELFHGKTLIQLRNILAIAPDCPPKKGKGTAQVYYFSKEIRVHYTLMSNRSSKYSAQVCYRALLNANKKPSTRGKELVKRTEAGFRGNTVSEVMNAIALFPLRHTVYDQIVKDVITTYQSCTNTLTFKTIWYCCLGHLSHRLTYRHDIAVSLFCSPESEAISNLIPTKSTEDDFLQLLGDNVPIAWGQVVLILNEAVSLHLIAANPLKNALTTIKQSSQPASQIVRHTLAKPCFTKKEEHAIVSAFMEIDPKSGLPLCVVDSQYLAIAIRLFTGMSVREICALQWKHFQHIETCDFYQFLIMQLITDSNQPVSIAHYSSKKQHRKVPCVDILSRLIILRLKYIVDTYGYTLEDIKNHPMILSAEYPIRKDKHFNPQYCSTKKISSISKTALTIAGITPNIVHLMNYGSEIEVDLNASLGDLFRSNFRVQSNHTCELTEGELCYVLGIKASRTYDEHYADYSTALSQASIRYALDMWADKYIPLLDSLPKSISSNIIRITSESSEMSIRLSNQYGMDCIVFPLQD